MKKNIFQQNLFSHEDSKQRTFTVIWAMIRHCDWLPESIIWQTFYSKIKTNLKLFKSVRLVEMWLGKCVKQCAINRKFLHARGT